MPDQRIRVLVVDDHPIVRKGLTAMLEPEPDLEVVGCASTGPQALKLFRETLPDVTLMDVTLTPEMTGIEATLAIRREFPGARIVVLSARQGEDFIYRSIQAGAITYLPKETLIDELVHTIREVHSGGGSIPPEVALKFADRAARAFLTDRELEVLELIAEGLRNKEIAGRLSITDHTVESHVKSILRKLEVNDRTKAVTVALQRGMLGPVG